MSNTISFATQYSDTVPDTPPSSGITAGRSYGTLVARADLGKRRLFEVGCTVPGDDRLTATQVVPSEDHLRVASVRVVHEPADVGEGGGGDVTGPVGALGQDVAQVREIASELLASLTERP